jgi:hypothetical protein
MMSRWKWCLFFVAFTIAQVAATQFGQWLARPTDVKDVL